MPSQNISKLTDVSPPHNIIEAYLKVGVPKTWKDSKKNLGYIRNAGVAQFISTYNRAKDLKGDKLLWGDEIEYGVFHVDKDNKKVRLSLRATEVSVELFWLTRRVTGD